MSIAKQKAALRKQVKAQVSSVYTAQNRATLSAKITAQVTALPQYQRAHMLFCFVGTAQEPDTLPLIQQSLAGGKRVSVPFCTGPGEMQARQITSPADLSNTGAFGILEPSPHCPVIPKEQIDFALVPCLACDANGHRLGHGGGYYDRYLAGTGWYWAVACPEAFLLPNIPTGPHDLTTPCIITEQRTLRFMP